MSFHGYVIAIYNIGNINRFYDKFNYVHLIFFMNEFLFKKLSIFTFVSS